MEIFKILDNIRVLKDNNFNNKITDELIYA